MAKPSMVTLQGTRDIPVKEWIPFLANFTRENRGAHAFLEVLGEGVGRQVATEDRPFDGISADAKDGENTVWIAFSSAPDDLFTHGVHGATAIRVREATVDSGAAIEVEAGDGTTTLLTLSRPEEYALPASDPRENRPSL
jgi:hypothetical protein